MPATIGRAVTNAAARLGERLEAELLLAHALERDRAWLYAHAGDPIEAERWRACLELVRQRQCGRPVAYLLGQREFYGREFEVGDGVLIPRPETELLIDIALQLPLPEQARVVDVGTGSGCIALTLALERPGWQVMATDISAEALAIAHRNRKWLGADAVELLRGNLLEPLVNIHPDLVISNPPYVAEGDPHLARGDVRFEPQTALVAGSDGLDVIRELVQQSARALAAGGCLLIEHGHDQAGEVRHLLQAADFHAIASHRDLAGIERVTLGRRT
ncbi:peptide chain release factor N(5)-glutamine methyltransferase [Wenzhouxiangella sp. XN201]|nr:peptide chain release factor N(5)-glutamine methyltransferase [Wenzhouxiangella sp. XN201]